MNPLRPMGGEGGAHAGGGEGEVGSGRRSGIPHLTLPSPPPGAERETSPMPFAQGGGAAKAVPRTRPVGQSAAMNWRDESGRTRLILVGAAVMLSLGMGIRQSLGLFLTPVTRDLAVSAADFTAAVAVQNIVWGLSQAPVGAIADRFGLRATLIAGAAIYVLGLGVMAAAGGAVALYLSGALIGVALSCTASSLALTAVAKAVAEERRSAILGVVSAAGSLGTLLV